MNIIKQLIINNKYKELGADIKVKKKHCGVSDESTVDKEVVLSLTSFPSRINDVEKTIISLLNQSVKPNRLILWLAKEQFPNGESSLPTKLLKLRNHGLEIRWVAEDIKSYKKLIPALVEFPDSIIITVDDDWYYHRDLVKVLLEEYKRNPKAIISNLITHPQFDEDGALKSADSLEQYTGTTSLWNKVLGCGGVLYPPNCLSKEVFNGYMDIAPTNDDIWFWSMAVLNNTETKVPDIPVKMITMTSSETQNNSSLSKYNEDNNLYTKVTEDIFNRYPAIKNKLLAVKE